MNNSSVQKGTVRLAKENQTVSDGQFLEILQRAMSGVTPFITQLRQRGGAQGFTSGTLVADAVSAALMALLPKRVKMESHDVEWWQKYYFDCYSITASFDDFEVPAPVEYPTRLLVMHEGVSNCCNKIVPVYKKHCSDKGYGWRQFADDLDAAIKSHDRSGTYAIRVRDTGESEFGFVDKQNLSTNGVLSRRVITTTLPERLIDGDVHLLKTEWHLDRKVVNLCPGTKLVSGEVPSVDFLPDRSRVYVRRWPLALALVDLRFRPAIC